MVDELNFYISLGERISSLRNQKGLTQEKLSSLLDLSRVSIVNIEKGRQKPSVYLLFRIAYIFNISIVDIVGDKKEGNMSTFEIYSGEDQLTNRDFEDLDFFIKNH